MKFTITLLLAVCALLVAAAPVPDAETVEIREPQGLAESVNADPERRDAQFNTEPWRRSTAAAAAERRDAQGFAPGGAQTWRRSTTGAAEERRDAQGYNPYGTPWRRSTTGADFERRDAQFNTEPWRRSTTGAAEERRDAQGFAPGGAQTWRRSTE